MSWFIFHWNWFLWLRSTGIQHWFRQYVKLRIAHAQGIPETFSLPQTLKRPLISNPSMHYGTCVSHVPWCMSGSLNRGGGETSRHSHKTLDGLANCLSCRVSWYDSYRGKRLSRRWKYHNIDCQTMRQTDRRTESLIKYIIWCINMCRLHGRT